MSEDRIEAAPTPTTDVLLVTCVKTMGRHPSAAKDQYMSPLFKKQRAYAESLHVPWFVLFAEHGLVAPDEWLAPYERYLPETPMTYRIAWASWVAARLELLVDGVADKLIEMHSSAAYLDVCATIDVAVPRSQTHCAVWLEAHGWPGLGPSALSPRSSVPIRQSTVVTTKRSSICCSMNPPPSRPRTSWRPAA